MMVMTERLWTRLLSRVGHWEWEHDFKTCPTGDRHCQHYHWKWGQ
jgi:hypothetical protein